MTTQEEKSERLFTDEEMHSPPPFHDVQVMLALSILVYVKGPEALAEDWEVPEENDLAKEALNLIKASSSRDGRLVKIIKNETTSLDCGIAVSDANERITLVFRGSQQPTDWLYNAMVSKIVMDDFKVHKGFANQLESGFDEITSCLRQQLVANPSYRIFVTGHSLGGALSTLATYRLSSVFTETKLYNYSFASPRVGDSAWKSAFEKKSNVLHVRVANRGDTVTAIPSINYSHADTYVVVLNPTPPGSLYPPTTEYPWYSTFALWNNLNVARHYTSSYWENLIACKWD